MRPMRQGTQQGDRREQRPRHPPPCKPPPCGCAHVARRRCLACLLAPTHAHRHRATLVGLNCHYRPRQRHRHHCHHHHRFRWCRGAGWHGRHRGPPSPSVPACRSAWLAGPTAARAVQQWRQDEGYHCRRHRMRHHRCHRCHHRHPTWRWTAAVHARRASTQSLSAPRLPPWHLVVRWRLRAPTTDTRASARVCCVPQPHPPHLAH